MSLSDSVKEHKTRSIIAGSCLLVFALILLISSSFSVHESSKDNKTFLVWMGALSVVMSLGVAGLGGYLLYVALKKDEDKPKAERPRSGSNGAEADMDYTALSDENYEIDL